MSAVFDFQASFVFDDKPVRLVVYRDADKYKVFTVNGRNVPRQVVCAKASKIIKGRESSNRNGRKTRRHS